MKVYFVSAVSCAVLMISSLLATPVKAETGVLNFVYYPMGSAGNVGNPTPSVQEWVNLSLTDPNSHADSAVFNLTKTGSFSYTHYLTLDSPQYPSGGATDVVGTSRFYLTLLGTHTMQGTVDGTRGDTSGSFSVTTDTVQFDAT